MSDNPDELIPDVSAVPHPAANGPEIRAQADDAIFGPIPVKKAEEGSARRAFLLFKRAALVASLAGFAWLAGPYFSGDQPSHFVRKLWALWTVRLSKVDALLWRNGNPNRCTSFCCTMNGACELVRTWTRRSASRPAMEPCVSRCTCWTREVEYVASWTTSATANPSSTLPTSPLISA